MKNKIRTWLIRKLGGFTEQEYNVTEVKTVRPEILPLEVNQFVDKRHFEYMQEVGFDSLHNMLANEIGHYIVNNKLYYEIFEETLQICDGINFKWRVWLLNPKDMKETWQCLKNLKINQ